MRLRELSPSAVALAIILASAKISSAFYLPGVAPNTYLKGDKVELYVNALTASPSQEDGKLRAVLPWDYYDDRLHFCKPQPNGPKYVSESLGSIIFGDRIMTSAYDLKMAVNESCKALCDTVTIPPIDSTFINAKIEQGFNLNWLVDGLPAGQLMEDRFSNDKFYSQGFPLGAQQDFGERLGASLLNNHYDIEIEYHEVSKDNYRVVGVSVQPSSRATSSAKGGQVDCGNDERFLALSTETDTPVTWTYSVTWVPSPTAWATRWDKYLHVYDPKIHWFSLINSAILVVVLSLMVMSTLWRALKKDIARYNRLDNINLDDLSGSGGDMEDGVQEDSGWKLVHGDVFRTPNHSLMLSIFLGNGAQLFFMVGFTIVFALLGFLSPSNRGSLGSVMILLYTVFGFVGGYISARTYKSLGGDRWKLVIALTPLLVPGIVFSTFFVLNLFLWFSGSSGAVPFLTMVFLVLIWFIISLPLSFAGSWIAFKMAPISPPVRTNQIPRQIPPGPNYLRPIPSMLFVGLIPFGAIFIELFFIMSSIWFSKVYYMFGFLFLCYFLMILTTAAVTILMTYYLLCSEDYHWHWRAFLAAGASSIYVFLNACGYLVTKLQLATWTGGVLYLGYSALISFLFFILTGKSLLQIEVYERQLIGDLGTIGFFASWAFVHKIYGSIKID
jgi:transmembrane 9 superfamily protein 2/4